MFGQSNSSPFGAPPSSSPFGSSANTTPAFGTPAPAPFGSFGGNAGGFGAPAPAPFGGNSGFGAPAPTPFGSSTGGFGGGGGGFGAPSNTSPFGAPAPAPSGGLFGAPAPSGGIFGSSAGGFGAPTNTGGGFGAPSNTGGAFGAPSTGGGFGAPSTGGGFGASSNTGGGFGAPSPSTFGGFGSTSSNTGNVFGAPAPSAFGAPAPTAFGAPPAGGLFGAPAPAPAPFGGFGAGPAPAPTGGLFGAPAPASGGLFGSPAPATGGLFGAPAPATGGLFGAPVPAPGGGVFGAPQQQHQQQGGGSAVAPYQVTTRQDGTTAINLQSISAMAQYENTSFEELRVEDYLCGNKGKGDAMGAGGGGFGFGAPAPGVFGAPAAAPGGLFGSPAPAPAFGAPAPGAFGAPAPGGFGFGAPAPAPSGGFGFGASAPAPAFGGFGVKAPAPSGGLFGSPSPAPLGGLFGAPAPAPSGGLFGAPAPSAFGTPASGGLFGSSPAPAPGGLFGAPAPAPTSLFGAAPAPAFGGFGAKPPAPASGLFGAPGPTGGLFGAPASSGGLFGSPAPAPGGFGAPPASGGLFGSSAPAPSQGFFGAPAPAPPPQNYYGGGYPPTSSIIPPAADAVLAQQLAAVANQRKELEKLDVWRGQSPQQSSIIPTSMSESEAALRVSPYSTSSGMSTYRASPKSAAKIRPRGFGAAHGQATDTSTSIVLGQLGKSNSPMMSPGAMSSAKRLVIMPDAHTPKPSLRLRLTAATQESKTDHVLRLPSAMMSPPTQMNGLNLSTPKPLAAASPNMQQSPMTNTPKTQSIPGSSMENNITPANGAGFEFYRHVVGSPQASSNSGGAAIGHLAPKLTKPGYIVTPSLQELAKMSEVDLATVSGFSVSREGHGSVAWEGAVDVRGVDLDVVVNIGSKDVSVYEQQEQDGTKPAEGSKLNRPAIITIPKVWPKPGESATAEQMEKFRNKLKKSSKTMDAEFISYDEPTGEWMFRVRHFSKYGLMDDDDTDDDDDLAPQVVAAIAAETHQPQFFESGERGGRSQGKAGATFQQFGGSPTRFTVPTDDDDEFDEMMNYQNTDDDEIALLSDVETGTTEEQILQAANRAYASLLSPEPEPQDVGMAFDEEIDEDFYPGENIGVEPPSRPLPIPPSADKLLIHRSLGVCARIAQSRGVPLASETDFGLRMGRSFRVGWGPNGTFLHIRADGVIVQSRPVFSESQERAERMLEIHRQYSAKSLQGPEQLPFFQLTEGRIGASTLITALDSYANSIPTQTSDGSVVKQAFSLLSCLMQDKVVGVSSETIMLTDDIETRQQANRTGGLEAFKRWMRDACSESAMVDVQKAEQRNDALGAVFATLTSGNLESATSIASKYGYHQLSALIAVGSTCANFVEDQVRQWQVAGNSKFIPVDILRVYTLLGGDMKLEEKLYTDGNRSIDWKRRLGMLFFYSFDNQGGIFDFAGVVETYQSSVDRGVAPGPQSEVSANDASCLLYRLLRIGNSIINGEQSFKYSISDLISPAGHASSSQDLAASFHLAASLSAIGCCSPLSELEMARLYDGYASQLMSNGKWELAVYVMLCSIGDSNSQFDAWRCARAKQLVLSSYNTSLEHKRDFLVETVGLPKTWFAECSATRAAMRGDAFEFINHASAFAPNEARIALEEVVVPSLLFRNAKETLKSLELLGCYASGDETLTTCVLDFFHLCEGVMSVGDSAAERKEHLLHSLVKTASDLEKRFALHKAQAENVSSGYKKFHGTPVPIKSFFAEVLAGLDFVKLQLGALQAGESIWDDAMDQIRYPVPMKLASQLIAMSKTTISDGVSPTDQQFRGII